MRDRDISLRMREMLTRDKVNVREGFLASLKGDLARVAASYFFSPTPIGVSVDRQADGSYAVNVSFAASDIRRFDTTLDIKGE